MLRIVIIVFSILFAGNAYSNNPTPSSGELRSPEKPQPTNEKEQPKSDQRGTEQSPIIIKMAPSPNAQDEAAQAKREKEEKAATDRRIEITTYIVAGATAVQAIGLILTIIAMNRTARRQLRAYLSAQPNYVFNFNPSVLAEIKFTIVNHGQTPAYKVQCSGVVDILPYPLPFNHPFPKLPEPRSKSRFVIHPRGNMDHHAIAARLFTANEISQIVAGTQFRLYILGEVNYIDVFKKKRTTTLCFSVVGDQNLAATTGSESIPTIEIKFEPTEQHNDAT
jgi:hypothetical protein